jgi:hypothetical protein
LDTLGSIQLDQDKIAEAELSFTTARSKQPEYAHSLTEFSIESMLFRVAVAKGDFASAEHWRSFSGGIPIDAMERARSEFKANDVVLASMNSVAPLPSDLEFLHRSYLRNRNSGRRDYMTCALVLGLRAAGNEPLASSTLNDYVREFRKERYPLPHYLMRLATGRS